MKASLGLFLYLLPIFVAAETVVPIDSVLNHVNIRMSADAKSEVVGKLQQGDSLLLVQSVTDWHEVKIDGGDTGFSSADGTKVRGEASTVEEQPALQDDRVEEADTADNSPEVVAEEGSSGAAVEVVVDSAEQQFSDSAVKELVESAEQADADSHESIVAEVDDTIEIDVKIIDQQGEWDVSTETDSVEIEPGDIATVKIIVKSLNNKKEAYGVEMDLTFEVSGKQGIEKKTATSLVDQKTIEYNIGVYRQA